jgi:PAS domain S-box-containing protein
MTIKRKSAAQKCTEILIIEDSLTQATQIKHLLESHNYIVSVAQNGKQAMDRLSKHKPSLVISDILMPEMNGYELCKKIKSNRSTEDIPVILLTRLTDPEEIIEGLSCGADSFITKPFNEKYLLSHIEKNLSKEIGGDHKKVPFCTQIFFKGKERFIQTEQQNVIRLMLDIYEGAIHQNERLVQTEEELRLLNKQLESIVEDRTLDLAEEIKLSNQIAERLKESEERFRNLYNDAIVGLYRTNSNGEILLANRALVEMLGFQSFEELANINLNKTGYGTSYQRQVFIDQIEKEGEVKGFEAIWICRDGKEIFVRESAKANYDSEGNILYYDGSVEDLTEQKRAIQALNEIQHLFETLTLVSPVGIFRTDADGYTNYVNPKWEELSGLSAKDASGNGWLKAVHPEDREKLSEAWLNNVKSKNESSAEYRFLRPDGSIVWVIGKAVPELTGNKVIGYIGTITDITERKQAEEDLIESEKKYRQLVIHSPDGIFINDLSGKFISVNRSICENLKYTEKELLSMKMQDIIPEQYHSLHKQRLMAILNGEGTNTYAEYEVTGKDGITHFVEIISVPYYKGKEIIGFQSIARDITERKLAEEELKKNQSQLINALKIAHLGSWEHDIKNDVLIFNDLFYEIFRTTAEQVGGYTMSSADYAKRFVHPEDIDIIRTEISKSFETDDPNFSRQLEHRIIYADGETGYINVRIFVVKDKMGKTVRTYGVNQDITEHKRAETVLIKAAEQMKLAKEKAEASDKLKTSFLSNISHEVRTPLNGILGFAEIMSQTDLSEEEKKMSLSMLFESSDRLLNTITNYMDISLITSGTMAVDKKDFFPGQIMKELLGKYITICSGRKFELLLKLPEHSDELSINSDPEILSKVVSHLLSNAIKFTEEGSIQYGYTIGKNELEFFVKDTGIGIGKESLKDVFERFIKEDRGPIKITEGSGLGLSISKGLVELLGGKIWVESESGKGTSFFFTIPVEKEFVNHIISPASGKQEKNKTVNFILVAEDDEINFFYLKALLKQNTSADIIHALNGREAIDKFKENPDIGLVLMDIKMPVMDGLEATRQIKAINRNIPVIAITAYAMPGDENRITEAGCDYYLVKPINKKLLLDKMAEYIVM